MEALLENLAALGHNPLAWAVAALAAVKTLASAFDLFRCPILRGLAEVTPEMAREAAGRRFAPPPGYLALMLSGIALAIGGLYMLADTRFGAVALGAMVIGTFLFMTEPTRLAVVNARSAVFAASPSGGEALSLAREALRHAYRNRLAYEATITLTVIATLALI